MGKETIYLQSILLQLVRFLQGEIEIDWDEDVCILTEIFIKYHKVN